MAVELFNNIKTCVGKVDGSKIIDAQGQIIGYTDEKKLLFMDINKVTVAHVKQSCLFTKHGRTLCLFTENEIRDSMNKLFIKIDGDRIVDTSNYLKGYIKGESSIPKNIVLAAMLLVYTIDLF